MFTLPRLSKNEHDTHGRRVMLCAEQDGGEHFLPQVYDIEGQAQVAVVAVKTMQRLNLHKDCSQKSLLLPSWLAQALEASLLSSTGL